MAVLIVEDDILVRMTIAETLQDAGFVVLEAGSADEALDILASSDEITAMVTDVRMPGLMTG